MKTNSSAPSRSATSLGRATLLCSALGLLAGCSTQPESRVLSEPPPPAPTSTVTTTSSPVMVTQQPNVSNAQASTIIVTQAPPQRQDVPMARPERPSAQHVWVEGYWTWRNERYEWMAGHWALPPSPSARWVAPRWEREGNGYRFYEGYWRY